jgi:hypothetical protein
LNQDDLEALVNTPTVHDTEADRLLLIGFFVMEQCHREAGWHVWSLRHYRIQQDAEWWLIARWMAKSSRKGG